MNDSSISGESSSPSRSYFPRWSQASSQAMPKPTTTPLFERDRITAIPDADNNTIHVDLRIKLQRIRTIRIFTMLVSLQMLPAAIGFKNMVGKIFRINAAKPGSICI